MAVKGPLTHWGRVTHICVCKLAIIGSDNGLSPGRRQAIIWINAGILLIGPLGTNLSEIYIKILKFSVKKMHLKMSSAKWPPFCLGLNVLRFKTLGKYITWFCFVCSGWILDISTILFRVKSTTPTVTWNATVCFYKLSLFSLGSYLLVTNYFYHIVVHQAIFSEINILTFDLIKPYWHSVYG